MYEYLLMDVLRFFVFDIFFLFFLFSLFFCFFFFKQKTAYEIYQCDWSSDVCSSDLFYRSITPVYRELDNRLTALTGYEKEFLKNVPTTLVMAEMDSPRMTNIHLRGNFLKKGDRKSVV